MSNNIQSEENLDSKIEELVQFFHSNGIRFDTLQQKVAYPNDNQYMNIPGQHDTKKWLKAINHIYYNKQKGLPYKESIRSVTQGWNKMEVYDFLNWLKFYEEGAHMKYKFAQVWYENGQPGYFLHIKQDEKPEEEPVVDENAVNEAREEAARKEESKRIIDLQRQKIIGRLDSAEKLLRAPEGQELAGKELEMLMDAIYNLKKKIHLVNKMSTSNRLYNDMIVREANILTKKGFRKASDVLHALADTVPSTSPPEDPSGAGNPGPSPGGPTPPPGAPNINTPVDGDQNKDQPPVSALKAPPGPTDTAAVAPPIMPQQKPQPKALAQFQQNMNEGLEGSEEIKQTNDTSHFADDDNLEVEDILEVDDSDELLVTEAQVAPLPAPTVKAVGPKKDEPLEVTEEDIPKEPKADEDPKSTSTFDAKMEAMLANVTIGDIVAELEDLSKIFKVREIPRRLSLVDMMLDGKGLASYFPSLSEAQNKALESNNYISTRVEEILSKLRGSMATKDIDLKGGNVPTSPEVASIKNKLQEDETKEKQRKQMRKDQENSELEQPSKETPEVEIGEDLGGKPPAPVAPKPPAPKPLG